MNYSKINVLNNFQKAMSIFSVLIANPSTGKSPSIEKIKNALEVVELFDGIREENSSLVNGIFFHLKTFIYKIIWISFLSCDSRSSYCLTWSV